MNKLRPGWYKIKLDSDLLDKDEIIKIGQVLNQTHEKIDYELIEIFSTSFSNNTYYPIYNDDKIIRLTEADIKKLKLEAL